MIKPEILIVDDEPQIRKLLDIALSNNDYRVKHAETGREGLAFAASHPPDLILLDLGLPDSSGHDILIDLRAWYNGPIIILSVINNEKDIVNALDHGATDYMTKPFRTGELLARIRAAIRHSAVTETTTIGKFGNLEIDLISRIVRNNGEILKLTSTEYNLLALFVRNEGRVLTHQYLLKEIWGVGYQNETQYLRVFVGSLRKKIEVNPDKPEHIVTESGVGYRFS